MAYASAGANADCDGGQWQGAAVGRPGGGDSTWRCGVVSAGGETLPHGATSKTAMTHLAIQEKLQGKTVDWLEPVSDAQYEGSSLRKGIVVVAMDLPLRDER